jgi:CRISPR-associated protein Cas2
VVVIVLTACPAGLRGHLTRWLLEISAGVFVGKVSARVRDELWNRVQELAKDGRGLMVYQDDSEQGLAFAVHRHHWEPVDMDGLHLMLRPAESASEPAHPAMRPGWSQPSRRRRYGKK